MSYEKYLSRAIYEKKMKKRINETNFSEELVTIFGNHDSLSDTLTDYDFKNGQTITGMKEIYFDSEIMSEDFGAIIKVWSIYKVDNKESYYLLKGWSDYVYEYEDDSGYPEGENELNFYHLDLSDYDNYLKEFKLKKQKELEQGKKQQLILEKRRLEKEKSDRIRRKKEEEARERENLSIKNSINNLDQLNRNFVLVLRKIKGSSYKKEFPKEIKKIRQVINWVEDIIFIEESQDWIEVKLIHPKKMNQKNKTSTRIHVYKPKMTTHILKGKYKNHYFRQCYWILMEHLGDNTIQLKTPKMLQLEQIQRFGNILSDFDKFK